MSCTLYVCCRVGVWAFEWLWALWWQRLAGERAAISLMPVRLSCPSQLLGLQVRHPAACGQYGASDRFEPVDNDTCLTHSCYKTHLVVTQFLNLAFFSVLRALNEVQQNLGISSTAPFQRLQPLLTRPNDSGLSLETLYEMDHALLMFGMT